jgi:hypothetical protein
LKGRPYNEEVVKHETGMCLMLADLFFILSSKKGKPHEINRELRWGWEEIIFFLLPDP